MRPSIKVSFCVTCCNRLWQLKQTLQHNLDNLPDEFEITLVDYRSPDGLSEWVWDNFKTYIEHHKLNFFEVKNDISWNVSKAKNLAHRISNGQYLFNLDADNFISAEDIALILKSHRLNFPLHQWSGVWSDGSYGRIGLPKALFYKLGGYDESMMPMGGQDTDLIERMNRLRVAISKLPPPKMKAIENTIEDKVSQVNYLSKNSDDLYAVFNTLNQHQSKLRLETEGALRRDGFATFKGLLNGNPIIIDGLNEIRPY